MFPETVSGYRTEGRELNGNRLPMLINEQQNG